MAAFITHQGWVAPMDRANVDTDAMMPKQYLKCIFKTGYGDWAFDDWRYLDAGDLQPAASVLLRASARKFCPWIAQPDWFQIHRWRYAQVRQPHPADMLPVTPSLLCGGDWCRPAGETLTGIDAAYLSGLAMANSWISHE